MPKKLESGMIMAERDSSSSKEWRLFGELEWDKAVEWESK